MHYSGDPFAKHNTQKGCWCVFTSTVIKFILFWPAANVPARTTLAARKTDKLLLLVWPVTLRRTYQARHTPKPTHTQLTLNNQIYLLCPVFIYKIASFKHQQRWRINHVAQQLVASLTVFLSVITGRCVPAVASDQNTHCFVTSLWLLRGFFPTLLVRGNSKKQVLLCEIWVVMWRQWCRRTAQPNVQRVLHQSLTNNELSVTNKVSEQSKEFSMRQTLKCDTTVLKN